MSATLTNPACNNSTVLKGDALNEVSTLKQHIDGDIVIAGSFQLVRTLIEHDLVDELRLKIIPVALGAGERLFGETSDKNLCASSTPRLRGCSGGAPAARLSHRSQLFWARIRLE